MWTSSSSIRPATQDKQGTVGLHQGRWPPVGLRQQPGKLRGRTHGDRGDKGMYAIQTDHGSSGARRNRGGTGI
jgi:hypothetical protein